MDLEESLSKRWPDYAVQAAARFLALLIPDSDPRQIASLLKSDDWLEGLGYLFEGGKVVGLMQSLAQAWAADLPADAPTFVHQAAAHFKNLKFIKHLRLQDKELVIEHGEGIQELIKKKKQDALDLPSKDLVKYFKDFATGENKRSWLRPQDRRALRVYFLFMLLWPFLEPYRGKPLAQTYRFLKPLLPFPPQKRGEDPIDYEEKNWKWFERICYEKIDYHPKPKGRRARRIRKKPPTR